MQELFNLGLSDETIKNMYELNPDMEDKDILEKKYILEEIKCSNNQIRNIISSNVLFISKLNTDVINLINCLYNYGFNNLNILFDANPYILNLDVFEIENYIKKRQENGELLEEIVEDLDFNPYLFNEM